MVELFNCISPPRLIYSSFKCTERLLFARAVVGPSMRGCEEEEENSCSHTLELVWRCNQAIHRLTSALRWGAMPLVVRALFNRGL